MPSRPCTRSENEGEIAFQRRFPDEFAGDVDHFAEPALADPELFLLRLVGAGNLHQADFILRQLRQVPHDEEVLGARYARLVIHHAESADAAAVRRRQRGADIKSNVGISHDIGIIRKAGIGLGIGHDQLAILKNGVGAKSILAGGLPHVGPVGRFVELAIILDQRHHRDGRTQHAGGQTGDPIKPLLRRGVQKLQASHRE